MRESKKAIIELEKLIKEELIFQPGMWPITEEKLAEQFGMSRTPVRELFLKLERENLIIRRNKTGTVPNVLPAAEVLEMYEIRLRLEPYAAALAAERLRGGDFDGDPDAAVRLCRSLNSAYEEALLSGEVSSRQKNDLAIHMAITRLSGSRSLIDLMEQFHLAAKTFLLADKKAAPVEKHIIPVESHTNVIDALERGDGRKAEKLMKEHIAHVKGLFYKRYLEGKRHAKN